MCASPMRRAAGVTLVELIVAIVIVGVAVTGVMSVYFATIRHSADPMVQQQTQLLAEAYLEEILLKRFYDPDTGTVCTGTTAGETRALYDNVCDFSALSNNPPHNQFDAVLAGLAGYTVSVAVDSSAAADVGGLNNAGGVMRVLRVDVTVTGPNNTVSRLSGYRVNYNCQLGTEPGCRAL